MTFLKVQPETRYRNFLVDNWVPLSQPAVNIVETATGFRVDLAAPGLAKEDIAIKVEQKHLTISAKKAEENSTEGETYRRREFQYTAFERSFRLPETIDTDQVKATFNNGILSVSLAKKAEHQPVVKTVEIV
jgi:HSP20 family protein